MRILIATGIYPPAIGGPAQYAKGIEDAYRSMGHQVKVATFGKVEHTLPKGIRHLYFAIRILWSVLWSEKIILLDTWAVAFPIAVYSSLFRKKFTIRIGGDFLWEWYVERTKKKVLLKDFYVTELQSDHDVSLTRKERFIFKGTKWILSKADTIVFSTQWQKDIWNHPYEIDILQKFRNIKVKIVQNYIGERFTPVVPKGKYFIASTRPLVWKNVDMLKEVFEDKELHDIGARLDAERVDHERFLDKIAGSYAVILVSLGDISPNMILDAVRCGKPFICTIECGLYDSLKEIGLWVDPLDKREIKEAILWLSDENNYQNQCIKIAAFRETHSWKEIAKELL